MMPDALVVLADVAPGGIAAFGPAVIVGIIAGVLALVFVVRWAIRRRREK
jgi:hypothetical protein